jgi:2-keto-4-pentenoate hydratase/2-oxohepta-3-ene-1,7-dioic acid hydratase in catechol pathway
MFSPVGMDLDRGWPGRLDGEHVVQLAAQTLQAFFTGGGAAREHAQFRLEDCVLRAPVLHPPSVRLFGCDAAASQPFFSFVSPFPVLATGEQVVRPEGVEQLVYRPALAAVIGAGGALAGFSLANVWTARERLALERAAGAGPAKSCDFGLSLGPVLATADEFAPAGISVRVDGQERERLELGGAAGPPWPALLGYAAAGTSLRPGELLLCAADVTDGAALEPGSTVELEHPGIGTLLTPIAAPGPGSARPS